MSDEISIRIAALRAEISNRLRPVCGHWPSEVFDEMVRHLAALTIKYDGQVSTGMYDRRKTDRLVAEMKELLERSEIHRAGNERSTDGGAQ
jgi:hypothetical protein